ncbi:male-enhanced antigen 1-like [Ylistrum balloti]|uniref:male-enhanced antigen 1-like n=1 Tax=Ylistrum balloti TaxID=509963 RepID=UPI002905C90E|nr:male-enhanced antigen 1-like [Ylistrum balloti]
MSPQPEPDGETDKGPPSDEDEEGVENIPTPQFVIDNANSESESESEDGDGYYGYQMLPQEPDDVSGDTTGTSVMNTDEHSQSSQNSESLTEAGAEGPISADCDKDKAEPLNKLDHFMLHQNAGGQATGYMKLPDLPKPESKELLWNKQRTSNIQMEPGHAEKVKAAMTTIHLPAPNIPDWAKNISEEDWHNKLLSLQKSNTS